jgi:glycosyltransferase involved in cell wall biosynthesis
MKVTVVNTTERNGGAAIACQRLFEAHQLCGHDVQYLFMDSETNESQSRFSFLAKYPKKLKQLKLYFEKLHFSFFQKSKNFRFKYSTAKYGYDISKHPAIQEADVINIHWVQQGFLSIESIQKLIRTGKPLVWTLHDMWPFTGGCHYTEECQQHLKECGACFMLKNPSPTDLSHRLWLQKRDLYAQKNISFITSSKWLRDAALESSLLKNQSVQAIPIPVDSSFFKPKKKASDRKYSLLIQAMNLKDERKGLKYFLECLNYLKEKHPDSISRIRVNYFGKTSSPIMEEIGFECKYYGFLSDPQAILDVYQDSDVLVMPSLQDNLPNVVLEGIACGLPVVGFNTGGIPEMVLHKENGYITEKHNSQGLAEGIIWVLESEERYSKLSKASRNLALTEYGQQYASAQYFQAYEAALKAVIEY